MTNVTVFVEASAPGYYTATNSATVTITPRDLAGATVAAIGDQTFAGSPLTPAVSVQIGGLRPAAGVDYDAAYANNAAPGTATVTLTGKGNYTGATSVTFRIVAPPTPPKPTPTPKPKTYKVKFSANGGALPKGKKMSAQAFTLGKAKKLRKNAFTRKGYVFIGWSTRKNGPVAYKNGRKVKNIGKAGKTVTLYAVWAKETYKVAFDASGGRGKMPVQMFRYGTAQKLYANKFTRKGYFFGGWAMRDPLATVRKVAYKDGQAVKNLSRNGGTVKLYAVWKRR